jgi:hypothetical protein
MPLSRAKRRDEIVGHILHGLTDIQIKNLCRCSRTFCVMVRHQLATGPGFIFVQQKDLGAPRKLTIDMLHRKNTPRSFSFSRVLPSGTNRPL